MGNCVKSGKPQEIAAAPIVHSYPRVTSVNIKNFNMRGTLSSMSNVTFRLTEPTVLASQRVTLENRTIWVSSCVLPGIDPRGEMHKECQDLCFYHNSADSFLVTLYDGHGLQGEKLVKFCREVAEKYVSQHEADKTISPPEFLTNLTHHCDTQLTAAKAIVDSYNTGCTEVLAYIMNDTLHCAGVGDSRVILATTKPPKHAPAPVAVLGEERKMLEPLKNRNKKINIKLEAVQLTRDQKPEDPEELKRITQAGGRVQRLTDDRGNKVGPYRVWEMHLNTPGLAMSRSIGDGSGRHLGIIPTPVTTSYPLSEGTDYFIVAASDGVWDVFENQEVVSFVEFYREKCVRGMEEPPQHDVISCLNTCIAQLLCEEARQRWYAIVEEEDVLIDDISCVIVELISGTSGDLVEYIRRTSVRGEEPQDEGLAEFKRSPTLNDVKVRDPRRGSIVGRDALLQAGKGK